MTSHVPVLLKESIDGLALSPEKVFVDGTFGGGGHSREVVRRFGTEVRVIGIDQDPKVARENPEFDVRTENFRHIGKALGITKPDAILLDIGLSSDQLESSERGFSFSKDEPLDMRMAQVGVSARDILNSWDSSAIELILRGFGEEKYSKRIAGEIVRRREMKPFETTTELVEAVKAAKPFRHYQKIHPATQTFQALRIAVNEELTALEDGLRKSFEVLNPGGRLAVITFHSLEDRIVKNYFRDLGKEKKGEIINKKPIEPSESEVADNPRSRSAKLRIIKKL